MNYVLRYMIVLWWEYNYDSAVNFTPRNQSWILCWKEIAVIENLINFPFVGLTSDFDDSVRILEKMFPDYFDSLSHSFDQVQQFARDSTSTGHKEQQEKATNETLAKIADRMPYELKLYEIIKKRYEQLKSYYLFDGPVPDFLLESIKHLNLSAITYWSKKPSSASFRGGSIKSIQFSNKW